MSLEEQFRQIKDCRYIRHYTPKGSEEERDK